jgi:hypothetical protein
MGYLKQFKKNRGKTEGKQAKQHRYFSCCDGNLLLDGQKQSVIDKQRGARQSKSIKRFHLLLLAEGGSGIVVGELLLWNCDTNIRIGTPTSVYIRPVKLTTHCSQCRTAFTFQPAPPAIHRNGSSVTVCRLHKILQRTEREGSTHLLSIREGSAGDAGASSGDDLDLASASVHREARHTGLRLAGKANIPVMTFPRTPYLSGAAASSTPSSHSLEEQIARVSLADPTP